MREGQTVVVVDRHGGVAEGTVARIASMDGDPPLAPKLLDVQVGTARLTDVVHASRSDPPGTGWLLPEEYAAQGAAE